MTQLGVRYMCFLEVYGSELGSEPCVSSRIIGLAVLGRFGYDLGGSRHFAWQGVYHTAAVRPLLDGMFYMDG